MNKVGKNMKILRLSLFNLKKSKKEAFAIAFLTLVSTLMIGIFMINASKVGSAFDRSFEESGSVNSSFFMDEEYYRDTYKNILEKEYSVDKLSKCDALHGLISVEKGGEKTDYYLLFVTEDTELKLEDFAKLESLSESEISSIEHPIWLPSHFKYNMGYQAGDILNVESKGTKYPFTVVGFYNTGLLGYAGMGYKCIVNTSDFRLLSSFYSKEILVSFDASDDFSMKDYFDRCKEVTGENLKGEVSTWFDYEKTCETTYINIVFYLMILISLISFAASCFLMIKKIGDDIEDQMQSIGVLEALGYRSGEISLAYVYEYAISSGVGALIGGILAVLITPLVEKTISAMLGREWSGHSGVVKIIPVIFMIIFLCSFISFIKARRVKKYPPVMAFRKGISTHHFKRNILPLEKLKKYINLRLSFKDSIRNIRSHLGICLCIVLAGTSFLFCSVSLSFLGKGTDGFIEIGGAEIGDLDITLNSGVDPYKIAEELESMPEVRKVLVAYETYDINVKESENIGFTYGFDDYSQVEIIKPSIGSYPELDNEIMISIARSRNENRNVGDSIVLEVNGIEQEYIITGIASNMMNGYNCLYVTSDGYRRLNGLATADLLHVYLEDGIDVDEFETNLYAIYGMSAEEALASSESGGSLEQQLSAEAQHKIASLISRYGVTSLDWAVQVGDEIYTGNSREFVIKDISQARNLIESQIRTIVIGLYAFCIVSIILDGIIVAVILGIIASSNVKRRRKELGIMKGLGFSSKDLMTQIAVGFMPVTCLSVIISAFLAVYLNKALWIIAFGVDMHTNIPLLIIVSILMAGFCYLMTYISAGKIKKISVTELMTE